MSVVLYLDGVLAGMQLRSIHDPAAVGLREPLGFACLEGAPSTAGRFAQELALLPAQDAPWHFMVSAAGCRFRQRDFGYTVCSRPLPPGSFFRAGECACLVSPELYFVQQGRELSLPLLVLLGDELCGTYTSLLDGRQGSAVRVAPLTTVDRLAAYVERVPWMPGSRKAKMALRHVVEGAASIKESQLEMMLCLPPHFGGFGLPAAQMNACVEFDRAAQRLAGREYALCDLSWPDALLDVEYDGRAWHEGQDFSLRDKQRANALQHMGYQVLSVSKAEFGSIEALTLVAHEVARHLGVRLRTRAEDAEGKRERLHAELLAAWRNPIFQSVSADELQRISLLR